jgi:hypothetical protein
MEITKELKKELKENGYSLKTTPHLELTTEDEKFIGIPAEIIIKEIQSYQDNSIDLNELIKLDDEDEILVTADVNYADEFDMSAWKVMTVKSLKEIVKALQEHDDEIEWGFGTNEEMWFKNGEDLLSCLTFEKITSEESDILYKLFYGEFDGGSDVFSEIDQLIDGDGDGDEDDEEEDENDEFKGLLSTSEKLKIEKLRELGWEISLNDEESQLFEFKHEKDGLALSSSYFMNDLIDYYKKQK